MTSLELRLALAKHGILLRADGAALRFCGPADVLSAEVRQSITANRDELLEILAADARFHATGLPHEWRCEFDERAAILEFDAGLPRDEAERQAATELSRPARATP